LVNEVHGLMNEYGIVIPKGVPKFRQAVVDKLESEKDKLTTLGQELFWKLLEGNTGKITLLNFGGLPSTAEADDLIGHPLF
jgi:hypothetical protein